MNASLSGKDKQIAEMEGSVGALSDRLGRLTSKPKEAKSIIMDVYWLGFNEAVK